MALLSTSGVIVVLCILFGLYILADRRSKAAPQVPIGAEIYAEDVLEDAVLEAIARQQAGLSPASAGVQQVPVPTDSGSSVQGAKPGRLVLFGAGLLSLTASVITSLFAIFGSLTWALPLLLLVLAVGALGLLRFWAVQDRNRRRASSALRVEQKRQRAAAAPADRSDAPAEAVSDIELKHLPQPGTRNRQQLPVNHAVKALRKARTQHLPNRQPLQPQPLTGADGTAPRLRMDEELPRTDWQPVAVPRPTYLDAEVAHTDLPQPLELDQAPRSQSQTLAQAAGLNLDDVLRRRRA